MSERKGQETREQFNPYISTHPLNLKQVRHFVMLAETLNYRRAAEKLNMAQPPLTVSIQKFEQDLGTQLFVRDSKGVSLTPHGEALLPEAHKLLFHSDHFRKLTRNLIEGASGPLRVGFVSSATYGPLQAIVDKLRHDQPQLRLTLRELNSSQIIDQLHDRTLDVALVRTPLLQPTSVELKLKTLHEDHLVLAISRRNALAEKPGLRLRDLSDMPFIMYGPVLAPGLHAIVMLACEQAGFRPAIAEYGAQIQTLMALAERDIGVALVPSISRHFAPRDIVFRELEDIPSQCRTSLCLAYLADDDNPAVRHFSAAAESMDDLAA
ncbi:MAG: LysR family transcriptional regulator [Sphingobium sp.]